LTYRDEWPDLKWKSRSLSLGSRTLVSVLTILKKEKGAGRQWLTPAIQVTQEKEIRRIAVQS
jgi:hypothetical protein